MTHRTQDMAVWHSQAPLENAHEAMLEAMSDLAFEKYLRRLAGRQRSVYDPEAFGERARERARNARGTASVSQ